MTFLFWINFLDPYNKTRTKVNREEENGMDESGLGMLASVSTTRTTESSSENDRNVANRITEEMLRDDNSSRRHSITSTLVRQSDRGFATDSNFGSRRSIFRRSAKLTPNPSIITSHQGDESYHTANTGEKTNFCMLKPISFQKWALVTLISVTQMTLLDEGF